MDTHLKIIEALANGIDPTTGEALPAVSPYNDPNTIRALFTVLNLIKKTANKQPKIKKTLSQKRMENLEGGLPENAGLPWTDEQRNDLVEQFKSGLLIKDIALSLGRTSGAITSELKKQGLIDQ